MHILYDSGFRSTQAICVYYGYNGYPLNEARADLTFWVARITGRDAQYGLARAFLSKTYPLRHAKRPPVAVDASELVTGDLIEVRCAERARIPATDSSLLRPRTARASPYERSLTQS